MLELDLQPKTVMARSIMTQYFGANAGIELAALQRTLTRPKPDLFFEQECQRLTEVLLKRETRIKEIIEIS